MTKETKQPKRLTAHQAKILTIYTGYQLVPFTMLHADVQSRLGGDLIAVQSWSDPEFLKRVQEVYKEDLIKILPQVAINDMYRDNVTIENEDV